jgi:outer membrane protein assembly factor BamE (lipoprotein component of BamABCDE complex)
VRIKEGVDTLVNTVKRPAVQDGTGWARAAGLVACQSTRLARRGGAAGLVGAWLLAGALGACSPMVHTDGQIPDPVKLASIEPGAQTREEVVKLLGTPSAVAVLDDRTWYYISKRTSTLAFFEPDVLEQRVVVISFDDSGVVRGIQQYGLNDANDVSPVDRETPTKGRQLTVWDQMIGNLNRYSGAGRR